MRTSVVLLVSMAHWLWADGCRLSLLAKESLPQNHEGWSSTDATDDLPQDIIRGFYCFYDYRNAQFSIPGTGLYDFRIQAFRMSCRDGMHVQICMIFACKCSIYPVGMGCMYSPWLYCHPVRTFEGKNFATFSCDSKASRPIPIFKAFHDCSENFALHPNSILVCLFTVTPSNV